VQEVRREVQEHLLWEEGLLEVQELQIEAEVVVETLLLEDLGLLL
jgi:hypothetical protein